MLKPIQALVLVTAVFGAAAAAEQVEFVDGRTMVVESLRLDGEYFVLVLDSSASVSVPRNRVAGVRRYVPVVQEPEEEPAEPLPWARVAGEYADMIRTVAAEYDLDPAVITAMVQVESNFDPYAVSHKGACGLLQLIPATAERFGVKDVFDPRDNLAGGARYFRWLLDRFENRMEFALAAYNAGENAVTHYDGIPPYRETRDYVARVLRKVKINGGSIKSRPES
jgi:soluble lytic murein transglycosylase-like protein